MSEQELLNAWAYMDAFKADMRLQEMLAGIALGAVLWLLDIERWLRGKV